MEQNKITITAQPKWKSKYFWTAIVAQVLSIIELSGLSKKWGLDLGTIGTVVASLLQLLVLLGIFNDSGNAKEW
jgi:uncharacterized membrane protein